MADFGGDTVDAFRAEARDWLEANFPPSLKGRGGMMYVEGGGSSDPAVKAWTAAMGEKGWGVPTWPKAYGGGGLSTAEARVLQQEMNAHRRLEPDRRHGRDDVRPDPAGIRQRGAEAAAHPADRHAARCAGARAFPSPAPAPTSPRCRPSARTRATTGWSTARRSGPPAPSRPTGASAWCAPTPPRSTRASASC